MRYLEQYFIENSALACDFKLLLCSNTRTDKLQKGINNFIVHKRRYVCGDVESRKLKLM